MIDIGRGAVGAMAEGGPSSGAGAYLPGSASGPGRRPPGRPGPGARLAELERLVEAIPLRAFDDASMEPEFGAPVSALEQYQANRAEFIACLRDECRDRVDALERMLGGRT